MTDAAWIAADAGVGALIDRLGAERFAFVGGPADVRGIVTRFDLNSVPVYQYLYDQFARFEIGLRQLLRTALDDWREHSDARRRYGGGDELVVDELAQQSLGTLVDSVTSAGLTDRVCPEYDDHDAALDDLRTLRNAVAHYNPLVHTMTDEPTAEDRQRGARQLRREHALLQAAIDGLPGASR